MEHGVEQVGVPGPGGPMAGAAGPADPVTGGTTSGHVTAGTEAPEADVEAAEPDPPADTPAPPAPAIRRIRHPQGVALIAFLGATALLVAVRLGPSLLGLKTFSAVDILAGSPPWMTRWLTPPVANWWLGDSVDSLLPSYLQIHRRLWTGDIPLWSALSGPGNALMSEPTVSTLGPSGLPMLLLPTWWATGFVKLLQLAMAMTGMTLWLRRLGTSWSAGLVAGLLYCGSGFFVAWSVWIGQAGVAALIPLLFWALERYVRLHTARSALPIALVVAAMMLTGFPAAAGHAFYAGGAYFLVRVWVVHRSARARIWSLVGAAAAVGLGFALSAAQLLPMAATLVRTDLDYRAAGFGAVQPVQSFLSVFFPRIFNPQTGYQQGFTGSNPVEAYAYLGMATVALAVLAVLAGRWNRVARSVVVTLAVIGLIAASLVWWHGFWNDWMGRLPVFADNPVGRLRDLIGLAFCALAGVGFDLFFVRGMPRRIRRRLIIAAWVMVALGVAGTVVVHDQFGRLIDPGIFRTDYLLALGGLVTVAVTLTVAQGPHRWRHRSLLSGVLVLLAALTGLQLVSSTAYFWPQSKVSDFYPVTPGIAAVQSVTGSGRALLGGTFVGSSASAYGVRTLTGHVFQTEPWRDMLLQLDPHAFDGFGRSPTNPQVSFQLGDPLLRSPLLDRMSVTSVVTKPDLTVPGPRLTPAGRPAALTVPSGAPLTVTATPATNGPVPLAAQNLRGFLVHVAATAGDGVHGVALVAKVRDASGAVIAVGSEIQTRWPAGWVAIPVAGESLGGHLGSLTVDITARSEAGPAPAVPLTASGSRPFVEVIGSQDDGLRLMHADSSVMVWQRLNALPRIRWASSTLTQPDPTARLQAMENPDTPATTVVLNSPAPAPSGAAASLTVAADTGDRVVVDATATGSGYLVLADAIQSGWTVTIDGTPATLVPAEHAFGAVLVPTGAHRVIFRFVGTGLRTGLVVSALAVLVVIVVAVWPVVLRRRRRRQRASASSL